MHGRTNAGSGRFSSLPRILFALILFVAASSAQACCIGIYYAIDEKTAEGLRFETDKVAMERLSVVAYRVTGKDKLDVDESWDAMHRVLTNGTLVPDGSAAGLVVLGGQSLLTTDDWIAMLVNPYEAGRASEAIKDITEQEFRRRYDQIDEDSYGLALSDEDFAGAWSDFVDVRKAFARWAREGKWVLFVAAQ